MLISNVTILFSNSSPKVPKNKAFLVSNLGIFIFSRDFPIKQIRGCWFQIWQYCFQLPDRKYPNLQFLVSNLRIFILHQTLHTDKFEGVDFKYDNGFFEFQSENNPIELFFFFSLNVSIFYLCMRLRILKNSRVLISKVAIDFFKFQLKIPKYKIFFENSKVSFF